ncbi:hypothetical protein NHX12_033240 [Muraenolepis orangiensis]|uniref:Mucolipin extracytosolic domain-containing protein n=1 Tax=Muraenolepis orangiensis TaxID=630683 RepID=A0A9Q0IG45_9TELE|nr:hypothetical protein NHX12_033240 [Muraenolepis orangiensis]
MNPCEKYHARGRKPWKLMLQIIKIAIITAQLVTFGLSSQMVATFKEQNLVTFRHLFLKGYLDGGMESYALYRQEDVYDHIEYVLTQYGRLRNITVGNHAYDKTGALYRPLTLCQEYYRNGTIYAGNETFEIDAQLDTFCLEISPMLVSIKITFVLKAINLETVRHRELPDCYDFNILILFNNQAHSGRIKVDLDTDVEVNECRDWRVTGATATNPYFLALFDVLIILTCISSLALCTRSVLNGIQLQFDYTVFCKDQRGEDAPWSDRLEFVNGWYILIILSDTLTIIGSILKLSIQAKVLSSYDVCSIFLGLGTMFVWMGVLRYMGYFRKAAFPNVIRFLCCAGIIYLSYCFCGWIVLGPYHEKQQQNAPPTSQLHKFMLACEDLPDSGVYRIKEKPNCFLNCCIPRCREYRERLINELQ